MLGLILVVACSKGTATDVIDAAPKRDAANVPDASTAYRHTIQIDGMDDFLSAEQFPTTSAGYGARVTWDAQNIYVGYAGPDLDPATVDTATKWLFVYLDIDPGMPSGAPTSEAYNTQGATFPTGFRADFYVRWRCDATLVSLKQYRGTAWADSATVPPASRGGSYVEFAIPRAVLGASDNLSVVAWMINEKHAAEGTYAGLYADNFVDGYRANLALTRFLKVDFAASREPNDPANRGP